MRIACPHATTGLTDRQPHLAKGSDMALIRPLAAALLTAALLGGAPGRAQSGEGPFTVVESGERYGSLQDAVNAIGGGEGTIRIASGRYNDCAVQEAGIVTFAAETP